MTTPAVRYVAQLLTSGPAPLPDGETTWSAVVEIARRGRLEPLVLRAVESVAPAEVRGQLEPRAKLVAFVNLRSLGERDRVLEALHAAGVGPVVLLKGAVVSWMIYPDPLLRSMNDLDVLVPAAQADRAGRALLDIGYTEVDLFGSRQASAAAYHERLYGRDVVPGRVRQPVEIHTGFAPRFRHRIPYDAVLSRALPFPDGGEHAYRLDDADQLVHLAVHLAREQFLGPLKQLLDVHLWVGRGGFDWNTVIARSLSWRAATSVAETLRLSQAVFGTHIPAEVSLALAPRGLRGRFLRWWHTPGDTGLTRRHLSTRVVLAAALMPLLDDSAERVKFVFNYSKLRIMDVVGAALRPPA